MKNLLSSVSELLGRLWGFVKDVFPFLAGWQIGSTRQKQKQRQNALDAVRKANKIEIEVSRMSDDDVHRELFNNWAKSVPDVQADNRERERQDVSAHGKTDSKP